MLTQPLLASLCLSAVLITGTAVPVAAAVPQVATATEKSLDDPTLADEAQLEVSGTLQIVHSDVATNGKGDQDHAHSLAMLVTDAGSLLPLDVEAPIEASAGATFVGTVAVTADIAEELDLSETVIDQAMEEPLREEDPAAVMIIAAAAESQTALPVATGVIGPAPSTKAPAALTHNLYVAVVGAKSSSVKESSFSASKVTDLVKRVSDYWSSQSGGIVASIVAASTVRYTSAFDCSAGSSSVVSWWDEAAKKFTDDPKSFFASGTGRHLVVLTPDGAKADGPCATKLGFVGLGTVGKSAATGGYAQVIVGSDNGPAGLAHELGHNMSLGHANVLFCASTTAAEAAVGSSGCAEEEYNDIYDVMGYTKSGQPNIPSLSLPAKERLGFIAGSDISVAELDGAATNTWTEVIRPISTTSGLRGMRVEDPISGDSYWIEYRSGTGQDVGLKANSDTLYSWPDGQSSTGTYRFYYGDGVRILKEDSDGSAYPQTLVVATPPAEGNLQYRQLALDTRESYASSTGAVHVDVNWTTPSAASVTVRITASRTIEPGLISAAITGRMAVGQVLTAVRPNFRLLGVTATYQWLRDGLAVAGRTSSTYALGSADQGHSIAVRVTGKKTGFGTASITTDGVLIGASSSTGVAPGAPLLTVPSPVDIAGSPTEPALVFRQDTAGTGGSYTVQITSPSAYKFTSALKLDEDGVLITKLPWQFGAGTHTVVVAPSSGKASNPVKVTVAKRNPAATLKLASGKLTKKVTATLTLGNWSPLAPTGTVSLYSGSTLLATVAMTAKSKGVAVVSLPLFTTTGTKTITATFSGDTNYLAATSPATSVKVVG